MKNVLILTVPVSALLFDGAGYAQAREIENELYLITPAADDLSKKPERCL